MKLIFRPQHIQIGCVLWVRSWLGAKPRWYNTCSSCPGKVIKPLDHKGTLTAVLSCPPVVMAMLRAQLVADWLLTHPVGGATVWWSRELSWVCLHWERSSRDCGLFLISLFSCRLVSGKTLSARQLKGCCDGISRREEPGELWARMHRWIVYRCL